MAFVREHVPQEKWEFFNNLNIQYQGEHITADKYSTWVIDRDREIIFTNVQLAGRDYGDTYILIWEKARIHIYAENRFVQYTKDYVTKYHWDIKKIKAPVSLKNKKNELINLIREVVDISYDRRGSVDVSPAILVIDHIAAPKFEEGA